MSDGRFTLPKLALRALASIQARRFQTDEEANTMHTLAARTAVIIESVTLTVSTKEGRFTLPLSPDTATRVLVALQRNAVETTTEDDA